MSRICLVGVGDPSFVPSRHHAGPGLRCGHFATALARAGHDLLVLYANAEAAPAGAGRGPAEVVVEGRRLLCVAAAQADFAGTRLRALVDGFRPQGLVAASVHAGSLATRLGLDVPFWADVFGDPMAEAQAKALVHGDDAALARFCTTTLEVLARADRFSAVSQAQADALVGQLGLAGRLSAATAGEGLVAVIPCAAEALAQGQRRAGEAGLRGGIVPDDAFVVLWSGSFNTWCDVETAFAGLEAAMQADDDIHFVATGGPVSGHDERTHARFAQLVAGSALGDRFHLVGWVDDHRLERYYRDSDVGLNVERELYERRLGSENRVAQWMANGLPCVTTARSEFGRCLAGRGLCFACPAGDASALARTLVALAGDRARVRAVGDAVRDYAARHLGYDAAAAPLCAWAAAPAPAGDHGQQRPLAVGLVSEPAAMVRLLEDYLADLGIVQVAYRGLRWLWRRAVAAARPAQRRHGAGRPVETRHDAN